MKRSIRTMSGSLTFVLAMEDEARKEQAAHDAILHFPEATEPST